MAQMRIIKDLKRHAASMALLPARFPKAVRIGMQAAGPEIRSILRAESARRKIWDRGFFQGGWAYRTFQNPLRMIIMNKAQHASFVEYGRRAGAKRPPIAPIRAWALRRGLPAAAAWPIAIKIERRGIRARRVMRSPAILAKIRETYSREMQDVLRRMFREGTR